MEMSDLHDMGQDGNSITGDFDKPKAAAILQVICTPVANYYCPTRRQPLAYYAPDCVYRNLSNAGIPEPTIVGQSDYAGNNGNSRYKIPAGGTGVNTGAPMGAMNYPPQLGTLALADAQSDLSFWAVFNGGPALSSGIIAYRSMFRLRDITDGASNTYLAGEKYISPDNYFNGGDFGTDQSWDHGFDYDVIRFTGYGSLAEGNQVWYPPNQDQPGVTNFIVFGIAHPISFNMVFCDGSVQAIPYTIDPVVHNYLGSRNDGQTIDAKKGF